MPDFRAYVRQNLSLLGISGAREAEIVEELALEFQEIYNRALRNGLDAAAAWREVTSRQRPWNELSADLRAALGDREIAPSQTARVTGVFGDLRRDLRYAVRQLVKAPGFTLVAILMLALGIGANTAIFSLLNAILLRSLPVNHPEQLVLFGPGLASGSTSFLPHGETQVFSYPFFREFRRRNEVFSEVAAIQSFLLESHGRMPGRAGLEGLTVELVSGSYFPTLGINAALGRLLTDADDQEPGGHPVAVAGYAWWQGHMGGDPGIAGKAVTIGSTVYTIVGVAPRNFFGATVGQSPDLWIPLAMQKQISPDRNGLEDKFYQCLHLVGRLKPRIGRPQAQAQTNLLFHQILRAFLDPEPVRDHLNDIQRARVSLTPFSTGRSELRREFTSPLEILMVVVVLVLVIACANVANLLLARAAVRRREIAVRMTLGAERMRLVRQLLVESGLLALAGAILGVALAFAATRVLLAMVSGGSDFLPIRVTPDAGVLAYAAGLSIVTVLLFGVVPALQATRVDLARSLNTGRGLIAAAMRGRLARGLVAAQVALSLVLLAGASLFLRSLSNLTQVNVGFDKQNVLRFKIDAPAAGYHLDQSLESLMSRIEERVDAVPGVRGAAFALSVFDGGGSSSNDINVPGRQRSEHDPSADFNVVGPQYLDVMRMPVLLGRALQSRDNAAAPKVAVINETMARIYFPGASPLGRTFAIGDKPEWQNLEIVGVVKDAKYMALQEKQMPAAFFPYQQHTSEFITNLVTRYTGDPAVLVPGIRKGIAEVDPNLPVGNVRQLAAMVDDFTLNQRLVAQLATFFGLLAALLAGIGIYGVMSYAIRRRTNEFGIRMALGANRSNVLWVVLRETLVLAAAGLVAGLALALASGSLVQNLLFGLQPNDPAAIGLAMLVLIVAALLAGYLPALRATRIDPSTALRYE